MIHFWQSLISRFADSCDSTSLFGLPTWYKYLEGQHYVDTITGGDACRPLINGLGDVWLILAAVIEILLRVAAFAALGLIIWGGIQFIIGQGEPDRVSEARSTIVNALIGLAVAVAATAVVTFAAGRFIQS